MATVTSSWSEAYRISNLNTVRSVFFDTYHIRPANFVASWVKTGYFINPNAERRDFVDRYKILGRVAKKFSDSYRIYALTDVIVAYRRFTDNYQLIPAVLSKWKDRYSIYNTLLYSDKFVILAVARDYLIKAAENVFKIVAESRDYTINTRVA